jgi:hypothetical protein
LSKEFLVLITVIYPGRAWWQWTYFGRFDNDTHGLHGIIIELCQRSRVIGLHEIGKQRGKGQQDEKIALDLR